MQAEAVVSEILCSEFPGPDVQITGPTQIDALHLLGFLGTIRAYDADLHLVLSLGEVHCGFDRLILRRIF